ncbi:MAG: hypothetical protein ACYDIC_12095, partial [Desulfobaccales bacterium]
MTEKEGGLVIFLGAVCPREEDRQGPQVESRGRAGPGVKPRSLQGNKAPAQKNRMPARDCSPGPEPARVHALPSWISFLS